MLNSMSNLICLGDEGVPIQVDGEAWIQPPGMIRIIHKNRMKMLCRNRVWLFILHACLLSSYYYVFLIYILKSFQLFRVTRSNAESKNRFKF